MWSKPPLRYSVLVVGITLLTLAGVFGARELTGQEKVDAIGRKIDMRPLPDQEPGRFIMAYLRTMQERFRQRNQRYGELPEVWHDPLRNWTPVTTHRTWVWGVI